MSMPAVPSSLLTEQERVAELAAHYAGLADAHRAAAERRVSERLAQGFDLGEALRFASTELRAGRRAAVLRDVVRAHAAQLL